MQSNSSSRQARRTSRRKKQQRRSFLASQSTWLIGGAAIVVALVVGFVFLGGDDAEATMEPVSSLGYEQSPNHIHGIGFDHQNERLLLATHFGLFAREGEQLYQVGNSRSDLMGFTMNPSEPSEIFISGHPQGGGNLGVHRSIDGGLNFNEIYSGPNGQPIDFHMMTLSSADPDWFYGSFMGQLFRSDDAGENWTTLTPNGLPERGLCWGAPCLAGDSGDPARVYAGTEQGLMVSTDAGESWNMLNSDLGQVAAVTVDPQDPDRIFAYTEAMGLALSTDGGETWETRQGDLVIQEGGYVFAIALDQSDPDHLFVGTMTNQVFETRDGGATWSLVV